MLRFFCVGPRSVYLPSLHCWLRVTDVLLALVFDEVRQEADGDARLVKAFGDIGISLRFYSSARGMEIGFFSPAAALYVYFFYSSLL